MGLVDAIWREWFQMEDELINGAWILIGLFLKSYWFSLKKLRRSSFQVLEILRSLFRVYEQTVSCRSLPKGKIG
jgi:hypothetical protein